MPSECVSSPRISASSSTMSATRWTVFMPASLPEPDISGRETERDRHDLGRCLVETLRISAGGLEVRPPRSGSRRRAGGEGCRARWGAGCGERGCSPQPSCWFHARRRWRSSRRAALPSLPGRQPWTLRVTSRSALRARADRRPERCGLGPTGRSPRRRIPPTGEPCRPGRRQPARLRFFVSQPRLHPRRHLRPVRRSDAQVVDGRAPLTRSLTC